jgi:hypothetical protein
VIKGLTTKANRSTVFLVLVIVTQVVLCYWALFVMGEESNKAIPIPDAVGTTTIAAGEEADEAVFTGKLVKVTPIGVGMDGRYNLILEFEDETVLACWQSGYASFKLNAVNKITLIASTGAIKASDYPRPAR